MSPTDSQPDALQAVVWSSPIFPLPLALPPVMPYPAEASASRPVYWVSNTP